MAVSPLLRKRLIVTKVEQIHWHLSAVSYCILSKNPFVKEIITLYKKLRSFAIFEQAKHNPRSARRQQSISAWLPRPVSKRKDSSGAHCAADVGVWILKGDVYCVIYRGPSHYTHLSINNFNRASCMTIVVRALLFSRHILRPDFKGNWRQCQFVRT